MLSGRLDSSVSQPRVTRQPHDGRRTMNTIAPQVMPPAPPLPPLQRRARPDAARRADGLADFLQRSVAALTAFAEAHERNIRGMAELHAQFIAQQAAAAAQIAGLRAGQQAGQSTAMLAAAGRPGPKLDRQTLEDIAGRKRSIASVFGPRFAAQGGHRYELRIPAPPMLFTDRITGIEGEPGSMGSGRIWAECDITADTIGLDPSGRASSFVLGEVGQANMLLASWLGADLGHKGLHRYRLLNAELEPLGPNVRLGETLAIEIVLERQTSVGGLRLFFFATKASCGGRDVARGRFSAGMFTEAELARPQSLDWRAADDDRALGTGFVLPDGASSRRKFDSAALAAFQAGRIAECFGPGFEAASSHARTPRVATPAFSLLHEVPTFDPAGGPWGRGHLRALQLVRPDDWYFAAHLPGDPCMPGFIMIEGAVQALGFHLTALGMTVDRDHWRFQQRANNTVSCRFRGQITPGMATLVYDVYIESLGVGVGPGAVADVTCSVDGRVVCHVRRMALDLVEG